MKKDRQNNCVVSTSRWLAYATAGAATALTCAPSAEAEIHYSGVINAKFSNNIEKQFQLVPGVVLQLSHQIHYYGTSTKDGGSAFVNIFGPEASVAGFYTCASNSDVASVSNLARSDHISERPFVPQGGLLATAEGLLCGGGPRGQFRALGDRIYWV